MSSLFLPQTTNITINRIRPNYSEHALSSGEEAAAIAYIQIKLASGQTRWGSAVDTNIELASIKAILSAVNRASILTK